MGLAVYNSIILDLSFPGICYRKLLSPSVVPAANDNTVGVVENPTLDDLNEIMPVSKKKKNYPQIRVVEFTTSQGWTYTPWYLPVFRYTV